MSNNLTVHRDEDGDYSDWIELFNGTDSTVRLQGFGLSDDPDTPFRWIFPDVGISPGKHFLVYASGKDKAAIVIHLETVIDWYDVWRYFIGENAPPADWHALNFDDSQWPAGESGFGYGDEDDSTYVGPPDPFTPGPVSVFIRRKFDIGDRDHVTGILLHVDYDDAFVAYLNGTEVARSNIGIPGIPPDYNQFADSDHEAHIYRGLPPEKFRIHNFKDLIKEGENVLALQVHNVQLYSSDLTLIPFLTLEMNAIPSQPRGLSPHLSLPIPRLHANFKIKSAGETLLLSDSQGGLVDRIDPVSLPADLSFGRQPDGNVSWYYFSEPTPGDSNATPGFLEFADPPQFSLPAGFYDSPVEISLSSPQTGASIYYSLDGSIPGDTSVLYQQPIQLDSTTVIRARSVYPGQLASEITTSTFFINEQFDIPVVSLSTDPQHFFDWNTGIYVMGPDASEEYPHFGANFWKDWEKPVHLEFFEPDGRSTVNIQAGVQIFGSWSRLYPQKSLAIFARDRYGYPAINYQIFPEIPVHEFQAIILRNSGQEWGKTIFRDGLMHRLVTELDIDIQAYRPCMVFLNGQLWGIHNIREKMNEHYPASHFPVEPDNIDFIERDSVVHGDAVHYQTLLQFVNSQDLSLIENYHQVADMIEVDNFQEYVLSVLFFANPDWPWNNVRCWRPRHPQGKWRWMLFDMDYGFHGGHLGPDANTFTETHQQDNGTTQLLFSLLENTAFRNSFINRFADHLNTTFDSSAIIQQVSEVMTGIESSMPYHIQKWQYSFEGPWWLGNSIDSMDEWYGHIEVVKDFARKRADFVRQHIVEEFNLQDGGIGRLRLDVNPAGSGYINLNTLLIDQFPWEGQYFPAIPLTIRAIPKPGWEFTGWQGLSENDSPLVVFQMRDEQEITAFFEQTGLVTSKVVINEINYKSAAEHDTEDWIEFYNASDSAIDLTGWQFTDNDDTHIFSFPAGRHLLPDEYLVACRDTAAFREFYSGIQNMVGDLGFGFSSDGELLRLYDNHGNLIDSLTFGVLPPWPTEPNGNGPTLALKNPFLDNGLAENWTASSNYGTPGQINDVYIRIEDAEPNQSPAKYALHQNYPNPFNQRTIIKFTLPQAGQVKIQIFDATGRMVENLVNRKIPAGTHQIHFNANKLASGIYFFRLESGNFSEAKKMLLIR